MKGESRFSRWVRSKIRPSLPTRKMQDVPARLRKRAFPATFEQRPIRMGGLSAKRAKARAQRRRQRKVAHESRRRNRQP